MGRVSSKDRIIDSALDLFSEKGYDGVGVDLIAENAGLKGPSIYKHFKGKEAILEAIMQKVGKYYAEHFGLSNNPVEAPPTLEAFVSSCFEKISFTMHDPTIKKVRRIFMMEQYRNPYIAELTTLYTWQNQQMMFSQIFKILMEKNILKKDNPEVLATEFLSPVTLMIQICDRQSEKEEFLMEVIKEHFKHFVSEYGVHCETS